MHIRTSTAVSLAVALVGLQKTSVVGAMPEEDVRAGPPLRLDQACPNDEGKIMCASTSSLLVCNHARWRFLSNCPEGTACQNDRCINKNEVTMPVIPPANPPPKPPAEPTSTTSTTLSATLTTTTTATTTKPTSNTSTTTTTTATSDTSKSSNSKGTSIPNISQVSDLPIKNSSSKSKGSKPTGIPNISVVDKLPIPGKGDDDDDKEDSDESDTSSAAGQLSWNRLHMAIPVVSAIVVPYVISLLF